MIRFTMPDPKLSEKKRMLLLKEQFDGFLGSPALHEILSLLQTDRSGLARDFNARTRADGSIAEAQVMEEKKELDALREELYPLLDELGFFRINRPVRPESSHLLVLGGTLHICFERTRCAKEWLRPGVQSVNGLSCFRPIHAMERKNSTHTSAADTEFGVLSDAFVRTFGLSEADCEEDFHSDRNLNSISVIRQYSSAEENSRFRVLSAPSAEPQKRRADTADTFRFYLGHSVLKESDSLLFITSNPYCNRQFLQILHVMLEKNRMQPFDVIGCKTGSQIDTKETFSPVKYIQELISVLDWIKRLYKDYF